MQSTTPTGYKHSITFGKLKATKEQIDSNKTSAQYLKVIDAFLKNAVLLIIQNSHYFDDYLVRLLGWQEAHPKRKVSFVSKQEFAAAVINYLIQPTKELKYKKFDDLRLERGVVLELCRSFIDGLADYDKACNHQLYGDLARELAFKNATEKAYQSSTSLMPTLQMVRHWYQLAIDYKNMVLEKYTRLCLNQAQKDYVSFFNVSIPLDDIVQAYLMVASRALDKCDYRQGVLTTHIQTWLYTARTSLLEDIGSNKTVNVSMIDGVEGQHDDVEDYLDRSSQVLKIRKLAKLVDPTGIARLFLGIEEVL